MRVCFVSPEFFNWGTYGGFGYVTRTLSTSLTEKGVEVSVVTPRRQGQNEVEHIDGVTVYGYPPHNHRPHIIRAITSRLNSLDYYRQADADIYHSQAVSLNTLAAETALPNRTHIITFQDPYDHTEWERIAKVEPRYKSTIRQGLRIKLEQILLTKASHRADQLYTQALFLNEKARKHYNLKRTPHFLPNPVPIPRDKIIKNERPTVSFLARWDPQKRVEIFFELARKYPNINFIAMGQSHHPETDSQLRKKSQKIENLWCPGFVSEGEKSLILAKSWALLNTSIREALPVSFLEALAHKTPIISQENPGGLTEKFGFHVHDERYEEGLEWLMERKEWKRKGEEGRRHVEEVYEIGKVVDRHIEVYEGLGEVR